VAYEIALPPPLANIPNIFHVSLQRKYVLDPNHILESDSIQVKENLSFEVKPIRILDSQVKQLRGRSIPMVKVLWDLIFRDSTWEIEEEIRASYPNLFLGKFIFEYSYVTTLVFKKKQNRTCAPVMTPFFFFHFFLSPSLPSIFSLNFSLHTSSILESDRTTL